jgi:hypothetical protein
LPSTSIGLSVNTGINKMTKKIYYEKVGRKYIPVREYDSDLMDAFPKGTHLTVCHPGGTSTRYNVDPNYAAMIAAGRLAEDAISSAIVAATDLRMQQQKQGTTPMSPSQRAAWDNLVKEFGSSAKTLEWPSAREACEDAVKVMTREAETLMQHESVRQAYDHFQMVCNLTKEHNGNR